MPVLVPKELLDETGRSAVPVLFALKDRNKREFFLGFTHEEVVTDIVRNTVSSWKQMPLYLYQIQTKERDEPRPRGGLIRGREFTMFDGYSFDSDQAGLDAIYRENYDAYCRIFQRCGVEYLAVEADPGAIGGSENHEFMLLTESGEDTVLRCDSCSYAANAERAEVVNEDHLPILRDRRPSEVISTPEAHTVEQVCDFLGIFPQALIKTIICMADSKPIAALIRGDRELNLPKLARILGAKSLELAPPEVVVRVTQAPIGFAGPVGLDLPIYVDNELDSVEDYVVGANQADAHRIQVTPNHDFAVTQWGDIRTAIAGDACVRCGTGHLTEARGIEVGHIFKLGTKYSGDMSALFQNEHGEKHPILMGCYGLGVSRTMAAVVEAHNDADGVVWPLSIAPYEVVLIMANMKDVAIREAAEALYRDLQAQGVDVLLDDREERVGVKFKDMDLIGIPLQVVIGKGLAEGNIEASLRRNKSEKRLIPVAEAAQTLADWVADERRALA
jgi:prolyl-tRNA synthetase